MSRAEGLEVSRNPLARVRTPGLRRWYPAVHRLVAAEFFDGAARIFIEAPPPKSACLDVYGEKFADFLSDFEPAASLAYLPEVVRLRWWVKRALRRSAAETPRSPRLSGPPVGAR